jgi:hypothetical protein
MLLLRCILLRLSRIVGRSRLRRRTSGGVIDVVFEAGGRAYGDDARAEFDADGDVVVGDKAAFA